MGTLSRRAAASGEWPLRGARPCLRWRHLVPVWVGAAQQLGAWPEAAGPAGPVQSWAIPVDADG
jgi:hypothetical protein